jgi:peptidoglycan/xylan/chitin deacetylase (PgdA/CDA1 family)
VIASVRRLYRCDVVCLCYHAVSEDWPSSLAVTPARLEHQLSMLVDRGWVGTTFSQAVLNPPARRTLAVTFDDAFASVIEHALPILSALGLPATVFAPTAFVSARRQLDWEGIDHWAGTTYADELTSMDWEDLRELAGRGWEIGTHTRTHRRLTQLDDADLTDELESSRFECERELCEPCRSIAYPYGAVDERVAAAARAAGYLTGARMSSNLRAQGRHRCPRIGIYRSDVPWRFGLKLHAGTRLARTSRLWPQLHRSHRAVRPAPSAPRRASASS